MQSACLGYVTKGVRKCRCFVLKDYRRYKRIIYSRILVFLFPLPVSYPSFAKIYPRQNFYDKLIRENKSTRIFSRSAFAKINPRKVAEVKPFGIKKSYVKCFVSPGRTRKKSKNRSNRQ